MGGRYLAGARQRFLDAFADFRDLFPAALCYPKIIPVDEVITLTGLLVNPGLRELALKLE